MSFSTLLRTLPLLFVFLYAGCKDSNPVAVEEKEVPAVDPFETNQRLGRGVNFGNALEAPREGDWGVTLTPLHFQRAQEAGFKTIRLPVRWSTHAATSAPYRIDEPFFRRVDWAIDQALSRGMNVILNVHHYEEIFTSPANHKARWLAIWEQVAERYRYHSENLIFELLNEPHDQLSPALWNVYLGEGIQVVRETNPTRNIIVGPGSWNDTNSLPSLVLPDDPQLIVTVHFYEPFRFTHQGAEWVSGADDWLDTPWLGTDSDKAFVLDILTTAADWGEAHQRPIFVGEFGAYSRADIFSRVRWTDFVAREAERLGMSWAYWEFMSGFGLYNLQNDTWREELRAALVPPA